MTSSREKREPTLFPTKSSNIGGAYVANEPDGSPLVRARKSDPATSHQAAKRVRGKVAEIRRKVAAAVRRFPGSTAVELATKAPEVDRYDYSRQLPMVEREGLIRRGKARKCTIRGTAMLTWEPDPRAKA